MGEIMAVAAGDSGHGQSAPLLSLLSFLAALLSMVGEDGSEDGGQGGSHRTHQQRKRKERRGKAYVAKECIHCCNGVKQERDDLMFFFFFSFLCKSQTDTRHVTKNSP
jgi:hypothetical protein